MNKQIGQVLEFQEHFGKVERQPKKLSKRRARLRQMLLEEKVKDLDEAKTVLDIAQSVTDIMYFSIGTAHECGFADRLELLFDEIHRSNMTMLDFEGHAQLSSKGVIIKSPRYTAPDIKKIMDRDFSLYKENEILKELANMERKHQENKIVAKIKKHLKFFDKILYNIHIKIEKRLKKKIEVKFPITIDDDIKVCVYGDEYVL
tara:strand:- start:1859 stop:2467 length:609 start_codon:yes stop_codon:yes gene_type:complete